MLAYLFWHRPRPDTPADTYEREHVAFHRSLAHGRPVGLRETAAFRVAEIPWLQAPGDRTATAPGYEDWYVVGDFTALGVLNEAAVGRGHRTSHDRVARRFGQGAGALYSLLEGELGAGAGQLGEAVTATWVARPPGSARRGLGELLGDGIDPAHASLWRRLLVLGPAPEFCLLAREPSRGVSRERLPADWSARTLQREVLFDG